MHNIPTRIWLIARRSEGPASLEVRLKELAERYREEVLLLGAGPFTPEAPAVLRAQAPDLLVLEGRAWPEGPAGEEVLNLGAGLVVVTPAERSGRFLPLAERHPLVFAAPGADLETLWLTVQSARAARRRLAFWQGEVQRLQQRLDDRIIIERAKGILMQRLRISEEEAYNRLRVLSRRQRRPLRDIARSFLDSQALLLPEEEAAPPGPSPHNGDFRPETGDAAARRP